MKYLQRLKALLLYADITKDEYHALLPVIHEENRVLLRVFSRIATVLFFLLYIASLLSGGFASANSTTYLFFACAMLVLLIGARFLLPKRSALVMVMVYLFEIMLYAFGIHVSMLHPEKVAVSAVAFLLVTPLLFYDRPIHVSAMLVAVVAIFCGIVSQKKTPDVAETDIWNMITFGVVAVVATVFTMRIKIRSLRQSRQITYLSQSDLLTGTRNRNHYENRLSAYPGMCASGLVCLYADANGLHEMNNRSGHAAGDKMLQETANALLNCFGQEHTYRVGGDEFVAFAPDGDREKLSAEVERIREELNQKGYHVSFGIAERKTDQGKMNMEELVREAEEKMFAMKRSFYGRKENDRRSR